jgi:hypothetical protein
MREKRLIFEGRPRRNFFRPVARPSIVLEQEKTIRLGGGQAN